MSKGSIQRPGSKKKFDDSYDRIFKKPELVEYNGEHYKLSDTPCVEAMINVQFAKNNSLQ